MARTTKTQSKRVATSKKSTKASSSISRWRNPRLVIFMIAFAAVGVFALLQIGAQPALPTGASDIVAAYIDSKPTTINKEDPAKTIYESYSASYLVLADGSLICDSGNTDGVVTTGTLNKGQLMKLHGELQDLDIESEASVISADGSDTHISTFKGYILADAESVSAHSVFENGKKPAKLAKMEEKILKTCEQATKREERGKTKEFTVPKNIKTAGAETSVLTQLANAISPKAEAAPAPGAGQVVDQPTADHQRGAVNYVRGLSGLPGLRQEGCLDIVAGQQAKRMIDVGYIYHNPNLAGEVNAWCKSPWTILGENVGTGYSSDAIFQAYWYSAPHRANIVHRSYNRIGTYAYKKSNGQIFTVTVFGRW